MVVEEQSGEEPRLAKKVKLSTSSDTLPDEVAIKTHPAYEQVMLDVNRCAGRLEHIKRVYLHKKHDDLDSGGGSGDEEHGSECDHLLSNDETSEQDRLDQESLQEKLAQLIVTLLIENPDLHYYQGFHDVCLTYMTICGPEDALRKMRSLVKSHFGIYMKPTMEETREFLSLIPTLVGSKSPKLEEFLYKAEIGTIFALSWVITWFSHVLPNEKDVADIFSFLELQDLHMILYLCAEIILLKEDEILELEPEMSTVHHFLSQVPRKDKLHFETLITKAHKTFLDYPPELLKERHLRVMKTRSITVKTQNFFSTITTFMGPTLGGMVSSNKRTAIIVIILASAIALQFDRWIR